MMRWMLVGVVVLGLGVAAVGQNQPGGGPATRPASDPDRMLKQLLTPARPTVRPLEPVPDAQAFDRTDRSSVVAVGARPEPRPLIREGEVIAQRVGRLTRTAEGQPEFTFEADGQTLQDPPMIILPNLQLMRMESAIKNLDRDLRFRISGMVTEYNGRNYILIETVSVLSEPGVR